MDNNLIERNVDQVLADKGLVKDYKDQTVRLLLYHLYTAIDIYRYMTQTEKDEAGRWYRVFKTSFSLRNFLKERKRHRERKNPPCTPLIRKDLLEKAQKTTHTVEREIRDLTERQMAFWLELEQYIGKYDRQTVLRFFYYWAEEDKRTGKMKYETESSWNTKYRLAIWSKRSFEVNDQTAELRLAKVKAKSTQKDCNATLSKREPSLLCTAEREQENERLFRQIEENKKGAVSREEWLRMKELHKL
jgi:hypothetical protein